MFSKVIIVDDIPGTPARIHRPSGTLYINRKLWQNFSPSEQKIILLHEEGHYALQTSDEVKADKYALERFAGTVPFSLRTFWNLLYNSIDKSIPQNRQRLVKVAKILAKYDHEYFGNTKILKLLNKMEKIYNQNLNSFPKEANLEALTKEAFSQFLKDKNITWETLSDEEKEDILAEFYETPFGADVLFSFAKIDTKQDYSNFLGFLAPAAEAVGSLLGGKDIVKAAANAVGKVFSKKTTSTKTTSTSNSLQAKVSSLSAENNRLKTQLSQVKSEVNAVKAEAEENEKKAKTYMYVAGVAFVIAIIAIIYALKNN